MTGAVARGRLMLVAPLLLAGVIPALAQSPIPAEAIACAPRLAAALPATEPRIVGSPGPEIHQMFQVGDAVLLNVGEADGVSVGTQFFTRRLLAPAQFGLRNTSVRALRTTGWVRAVEVGERATVAVVEQSCVEVRRGDRLDPFEWPAVISAQPAAAPDYEASATVLFGNEGGRLANAGRFVVVDQGADADLTEGQRVTLYRPSEAGADGPVMQLGTGVVVLVAPTSATLRLLDTRRPVRSGDRAAAHR